MLREAGFRRQGRRDNRLGVSRMTSGLVVMFFAASMLPQASDARPARPRPDPPKLPHPAIALKDAAGKNVLDSGMPISSRQTCGGDCHDYDFITDSFHFQQGKSEMDPALLKSHGIAPFNSSPGMFGKFSLIPNRQLTHAGITDPADADMSQPEWLTKCGGCHTGGGISEVDLYGRKVSFPGRQTQGTFGPELHDSRPRDGKGSALGLGEERHRRGRLFPLPRSQGQPRRAPKANGRGEFPLGEQRDAGPDGHRHEKVRRGAMHTTAPPSTPTEREARGPEPLRSDPRKLRQVSRVHGPRRHHHPAHPARRHHARGTEKAGWIYNGAKISETVSPHIAGKETMTFPWDAHAAKGVVCIDCHFAPNNPGRMIHDDPKKNLRYKPISEDIAVYLKRPDHNFARGNIPPETVNLESQHHERMRGLPRRREIARLPPLQEPALQGAGLPDLPHTGSPFLGLPER